MVAIKNIVHRGTRMSLWLAVDKAGHTLFQLSVTPGMNKRIPEHKFYMRCSSDFI